MPAGDTGQPLLRHLAAPPGPSRKSYRDFLSRQDLRNCHTRDTVAESMCRSDRICHEPVRARRKSYARRPPRIVLVYEPLIAEHILVLLLAFEASMAFEHRTAQRAGKIDRASIFELEPRPAQPRGRLNRRALWRCGRRNSGNHRVDQSQDSRATINGIPSPITGAKADGLPRLRRMSGPSNIVCSSYGKHTTLKCTVQGLTGTGTKA
jgi:hypothetical protein